MSGHSFNVLFVCQHNSARSIIAEALLRKWGMGRFAVHSAGPEPAEAVNPIAIDLLAKAKVETDGLHPKSWDAFIGPDAPALDLVFITCEECWSMPRPAFAGDPLVVKWNFPNPADLHGTDTEKRALYNLVFGMIERRIKIFCALPDRKLANLTARDLSDIAVSEQQPAQALSA